MYGTTLYYNFVHFKIKSLLMCQRCQRLLVVRFPFQKGIGRCVTKDQLAYFVVGENQEGEWQRRSPPV